MNTIHQKVTTSHLSRDAYLYVRQSSLRQVFEHVESTRRQYALRDRAVAMGRPTECVVVIDSDLGLSGADSDREGFKRLVAGVTMGWDGSGSCSGWRCPGLRVTPPTGIGWWRSAP